MATHDTIVIGASAGGVQALSAIVIEKTARQAGAWSKRELPSSHRSRSKRSIVSQPLLRGKKADIAREPIAEQNETVWVVF